MAHPEQAVFCNSVKERFPSRFINCKVLDIGSLDINGNNRYLFTKPYTYTGVDLAPGPNVDVISKGHEFTSSNKYDIVISTECFEHDMYWDKTIQNCIDLTEPGGLFMFTCATTGRQEHGTTRTTPQDSPFTHTMFNDYYRNLTEEDIKTAIDLSVFKTYEFSTNTKTKDLYFFGIKKTN